MVTNISQFHSKMFGKGDVYINGIEGFWSFAKENMGIMELVRANSCCTLKRWNGDTTTEMKILSHYCLIICWG